MKLYCFRNWTKPPGWQTCQKTNTLYFAPLYEAAGQEEIEYRLVDASKKEKWVLEKRKSFEHEGRLLMLAIVRDNTAEREDRQRLRDSEASLKAIFDNSMQSFLMLDEKYEIKAFNKISLERTKKVFNADLETGRSILEILDEDFREDFKGYCDAAMKGQFLRLERKIVMDDSERWFQLHFAPTKSPTGETIGVFHSAVDITDRHEAEQKLRKSEEKYRQFFEEDITGDFMSTPQGKLLDCNKRYVEILGYSSKDDIKKVDAREFYETPAMRDKFLIDLKKEGQLKHYVLNLRKKNGETVIVEENVLADRDESGNITSIRGYIYDITDRVMAEERLKESEQRLKLAIDASNIGLYDMDFLTGRVVVNDKYAVIYDQDPKSFEESRNQWMQRIHADDRPGVAAVHENLGNKQLEYAMEYRVTTAQGTLKWLHDAGRVVELNSDNTPKRVLGTILDISEQKWAEVERLKLINELTQQNTNLKQFSYIVSHNLRKPVANLSGLMEMVANREMPEYDRKERVRVMEMITRSVKELEEVIMDLDQILVVRHGSGKQFEKISVADVIRRAMKLLTQEIAESKARLTTDLKVRKVRAIKSYIHSILYNLISNAVKYSRSSEQPQIHIATQRKNGEVVLEVSDNGVGMNLKKDLPKLFNLYTRLNVQKEGRGVGLFLVKTQVEFMNGRIEVDSKPNKGTTFTIYLPETQSGRG